jgi:hypothetical protein
MAFGYVRHDERYLDVLFDEDPTMTIDLTPAAARVLGFSGLAHVTLDVIDRRG